MNTLEPKKFAIAKNSKGIFGFITREKGDDTKGKWKGDAFDISDKSKCVFSELRDGWSSSFPEVICYIDPKTVYAGYQDAFNDANIVIYLNRYFQIEALKEAYSNKHGFTVGNVFPLVLESSDVFNSVSIDEFSGFMDSILTEKTGTHSTHCCIDHGCKYIHESCPVVKGFVIQQYQCEGCSNEESDLSYLMCDLKSKGPSYVISSLRNDLEFKAKLQLMIDLGIQNHHIL